MLFHNFQLHAFIFLVVFGIKFLMPLNKIQRKKKTVRQMTELVNVLGRHFPAVKEQICS